jgi:hypothetical protein
MAGAYRQVQDQRRLGQVALPSGRLAAAQLITWVLYSYIAALCLQRNYMNITVASCFNKNWCVLCGIILTQDQLYILLHHVYTCKNLDTITMLCTHKIRPIRCHDAIMLTLKLVTGTSALHSTHCPLSSIPKLYSVHSCPSQLYILSTECPLSSLLGLYTVRSVPGHRYLS